MNKKHLGSSLDSLINDTVRDRKEFDLLVKKQVIARQIAFVMEAQNISKTELAKRIQTSRPIIDRILAPERGGVSFDMMYVAAQAVGLNVQISIPRRLRRAA
jgi:antitoxin HicB